jgi:hypothetical protein
MAQCLIDVFVHNRRRTLHASLAHIENKNEPRNNPSNL